MSVRVRYAPSPTGFTHIGGLRTALYNWLFARRHGGTFILRIEDTDRERFVEGATENLCRSFKACGIVPDEGVWIDDEGKLFERGAFGPYTQSARKEKHRAYAEQLLNAGKAYYCFCTSERLEELRKEQELLKKPTMYDGKCRDLDPVESARRAQSERHVIRFRVPREGTVTVTDLILGESTFQCALIDDQVLVKSDGFPTYHLAAMCDDHDMGITHVIRGPEWFPSAPKHVLILQAFGWEVPKFAHVPLLLNPDRSKLSKRQGDVAVEDYLNKGYVPEALVNFVALLGWNPTDDREIFTKEELATLFDLSKVNKSGAVFSTDKLQWLNQHYVRQWSDADYLAWMHRHLKIEAKDPALLDRLLLMARDRVAIPADALPVVEPLLAEPDYAKASLAWKTQAPAEAKERLSAARELVASWDASRFDAADFAATAETEAKGFIAAKGWGNGEVLWPLRVALSGQDKSPTPFDLLRAFGKERSLARIDAAIAYLAKA
jgi:glutamyl-tRNA synthetase